MKEQSHKDEMSAALRGDFARLRDRGVAVSLAPPAADPLPEVDEPVHEPAPPERDPGTPAPVAEAPPVEEASDAPEPEPEPEPDGTGSWLDRLLGR